MLKLPTATYYGLDEAGTAVWQALAQPCGTGDLVALIRSEFDIDEEGAVRDLRAFLDELLAEGLVESPADAAMPSAPAPIACITARNSRPYSPPVLERGLLRNAAHHPMGSRPDGGMTPGGTTQFS